MPLREGDRVPDFALPGLAPLTGEPCGTVTQRELLRDGRPVLLVFLRWLG